MTMKNTVKHDLRWFEEYAENVDILKPLTMEEWAELAALLHKVNQNKLEKYSEEEMHRLRVLSLEQQNKKLLEELIKRESVSEGPQIVIESAELYKVNQTLRAQLEWLWNNCKIIYYEADDCMYPVEHFKAAQKDNRKHIEQNYMKKDLGND